MLRVRTEDVSHGFQFVQLFGLQAPGLDIAQKFPPAEDQIEWQHQ